MNSTTKLGLKLDSKSLEPVSEKNEKPETPRSTLSPRVRRLIEESQKSVETVHPHKLNRLRRTQSSTLSRKVSEINTKLVRKTRSVSLENLLQSDQK